MNTNLIKKKLQRKEMLLCKEINFPEGPLFCHTSNILVALATFLVHKT